MGTSFPVFLRNMTGFGTPGPNNVCWRATKVAADRITVPFDNRGGPTNPGGIGHTHKAQRLMRYQPNLFARSSTGTWGRPLPPQPGTAGSENWVRSIATNPVPGHECREFLGRSAVAGEFDGDPHTFDYVLGTAGIEYADQGHKGWLDVVSIGPDPVNPFARAPQSIPPPPLIASWRAKTIEEWHLRLWPNPVDPDRPGILLARDWGHDEYSFHVIEQNAKPGSGFAGQSWKPLAWDLTARISGRPISQTPGILTHDDIGGSGSPGRLAQLFTEDLDGDRLPEPVVVFATSQENDPRMRVFMLANRANQLPVWHKVVHEQTPLAGSVAYDRFNADLTELVDVNGDDFLDLVFRQTLRGSSSAGAAVLRSSSLSGVGADLSSIAGAASSSPCARPGLLDLDRDGYLDVITGGSVHLANPDGSYQRGRGLFANFPTTLVHIEAVLAPHEPRSDRIEVLAFDPNQASAEVNLVFTIGGLGTVEYTKSDERPLDRGGRMVRDARPFLPPGRPQAKDLAAVLFSPAERSLLWRLTASSTGFQRGSGPWIADRIIDTVATPRREPLSDGEDPARNDRIQDVAVALENQNQLVVLDSQRGYARIQRTVGGANERIVGLTAASVTDDTLDDILVLSREGMTLYLYVIAQDRNTGFANTAPERWMRFVDHGSSPTDGMLGFAFDPHCARLAEGVVMSRGNPATQNLGQIRFVLPDANSPARMVRSEIPPWAPTPGALALVITDLDQDDQVDVVGGEPGRGNAVFRIQRAHRQPGVLPNRAAIAPTGDRLLDWRGRRVPQRRGILRRRGAPFAAVPHAARVRERRSGLGPPRGHRIGTEHRKIGVRIRHLVGLVAGRPWRSRRRHGQGAPEEASERHARSTRGDRRSQGIDQRRYGTRVAEVAERAQRVPSPHRLVGPCSGDQRTGRRPSAERAEQIDRRRHGGTLAVEQRRAARDGRLAREARERRQRRAREHGLVRPGQPLHVLQGPARTRTVGGAQRRDHLLRLLGAQRAVERLAGVDAALAERLQRRRANVQLGSFEQRRQPALDAVFSRPRHRFAHSVRGRRRRRRQPLDQDGATRLVAALDRDSTGDERLRRRARLEERTARRPCRVRVDQEPIEVRAQPRVELGQIADRRVERGERRRAAPSQEHGVVEVLFEDVEQHQLIWTEPPCTLLTPVDRDTT
jgi:hypothetical protein